jgi:hypothetical protein
VAIAFETRARSVAATAMATQEASALLARGERNATNPIAGIDHIGVIAVSPMQKRAARLPRCQKRSSRPADRSRLVFAQSGRQLNVSASERGCPVGEDIAMRNCEVHDRRPRPATCRRACGKPRSYGRPPARPRRDGSGVDQEIRTDALADNATSTPGPATESRISPMPSAGR